MFDLIKEKEDDNYVGEPISFDSIKHKMRKIRSYIDGKYQIKFLIAHKVNLDEINLPIENATLKPFKCNHCRKSFRNYGYLNYHIESVHKGQRYKCDACDRTYKYSISLKKHYEKCHQSFET